MSTPSLLDAAIPSTDPDIRSTLLGTQAEVQLFDGTRLRGLIEVWQEDALLLKPAAGSARNLSLAGVRCIQLDGHCAAAPTQTAYRSYRIRFRDGQVLDGSCLEASVERRLGIQLCTEAVDGSPCSLFMPALAVQHYCIGEQEGSFAEREAVPQAAGSASPTVLKGLLGSSAELRLALTHRQQPSYLEAGASTEQTPSEPGSPSGSPGAMHWARRLGIPALRLQHFDIDPAVTALVSEEVARRHHLMPVMLFEGRLVVALENPADEEVLRLLRFVTDHAPEPCLAGRDDIDGAIHRYYGADGDTPLLEELTPEETVRGSELTAAREMELLGKQKPIVRLVNNIILDAIHRRASDIHLRPGEGEVELLFRIDGSLLPVRRFGKSLLPAMVARIKVLGKMDISNRRLPQDGQARMADRQRSVDLRISTIPTVSGESVVIRLLDAQAGIRRLEQLGLDETDRQTLDGCLQRSFGLFLVTGPTGAGKSTTLYAALQEIRARGVHALSVEDPVEYHLDGVAQIQVNNAPGYGFARALKHILRHDPDVIMIGEIRDRETAQIAVESALTGHLVLTTLHTNDAASAVARLVDMGIEPYLLAAALSGVLAQRLVRLNCPHCRIREPVTPQMRNSLDLDDRQSFQRGRGCAECHHSGYRGRSAVYEFLRMTAALRELIIRGAGLVALQEQAVADGMRPLTEHALSRARLGQTSLQEVYRVRLV